MDILLAIFMLITAVWLLGAIYALALRVLWWVTFGRRGKRALFVYSDNPKWERYVERHILPNLSSQVLAANAANHTPWWQRTLIRRIHSHWTEWKEHTPVAIVFTSFWTVKAVRFYKALSKARHGNTVTLDHRLTDLRTLLGEVENAA